MRQANSAFLTKLGFRILVEKDKLWSRVLEAKYCKDQCDIHMFRQRSHASNSWRCIIENVKYLQQGVKMEVGNGKNTSFWKHNWLNKGPLCNEVIQPLSSSLEDRKVAEFWEENSGWKWEKFAAWLPPKIL